MCSLHFWRTRSKAYPLPLARPPIHLECGFHPLSTAVREGGKDEKKNPLESQWQTSLRPTPLGENLKKHKTNHNVFFIPARSWRHKRYCVAGVLASHPVISTPSTTFPKMTSLCPPSSNGHFQLLLPCVHSSTGKQRVCSALLFGRKTFK